MAVDWSYAVLIGIVGFSMVFAILMILLFCIWSTGKILFKMQTDQPPAANVKNRKGPGTGSGNG